MNIYEQRCNHLVRQFTCHLCTLQMYVNVHALMYILRTIMNVQAHLCGYSYVYIFVI